MARESVEALDRPLAVRPGIDAVQMRPDPGFSQTLASARGELRDRARGQPQERCDIGRRHLLDLGVPEHLLPPAREAPERPVREAPVERTRGRLLSRRRVGERVRVGMNDRLPRCGLPARGHAADDREEMGPESPVRSAAGEDRTIGTRERLFHHPIGIRIRAEGRGQSPARRPVPPPQLRERGAVPGARAQNQVGVSELRRVHLPGRRAGCVIGQPVSDRAWVHRRSTVSLKKTLAPGIHYVVGAAPVFRRAALSERRPPSPAGPQVRPRCPPSRRYAPRACGTGGRRPR